MSALNILFYIFLLAITMVLVYAVVLHSAYKKAAQEEILELLGEYEEDCEDEDLYHQSTEYMDLQYAESKAVFYDLDAAYELESA